VGVQTAAVFPGETAHGLQSLIETVFAEVFCQQESADGRYGRLLCDLPIEAEIEEIESAHSINVVQVDTIPVKLPIPGPNFSEIINKVRGMQSGKTLRREMSMLGPEPTFRSVSRACRDVAADLASGIKSANVREVNIQTVAIESIRDVVVGAIVGSALTPFFHVSQDFVGNLPEITLGGLAGSLITAVGTRSFKSVKAEVNRQNIEDSLQNSVKFSCVRHPAIEANHAATEGADIGADRRQL
jgi:hypothetical protein